MNENLIKLNINAKILSVIVAVFLIGPPLTYVLIFILHSGARAFWSDFVSLDTMYFMTVLLLLYATHEILHVVGGMFAGAKISSFKFGIDIDTLSLECYCRDKMSLRGLKLFTLLPFLVLTPLLAVMGYNSDSHLWWLMLALSTSGCAYDLTLFVGLIGIPDHIRVFTDLEAVNGDVYVKVAS